jgi:putative ABC transport system permease protein
VSRFYLAYALRSLWRGGQRSALALLCIAFAVLSLVSMLILANIVREATVVPARAQLGGDFTLTRSQPIGAEVLADLRAAQERGQISGFTAVAPNRELTLLRKQGSGRVHFLSRAFGIDAVTFPLVGPLTLTQPAGSAVRDVLRGPGSVIVTRDVARRLQLALGDTVYLGGAGGAASLPLHIAGIAAVLPDRKGDTMLFGLETARALNSNRTVIGYISVLGGASAAGQFREQGWTVTRAESLKPGSVAQVFAFMLKGAGLLGLLLGGIGVANTLTVSLARRTHEIAILKTLGYRRVDLLALLGLETTILGLAGSILGGLAAIQVARLLTSLLDATEGSLLLVYQVSAGLVLGGMLAGLVSALAFGAFATLRASGVRPALLLRQQWVSPAHGSRTLLATGLLIAITVFAALGSAIMGSVTQGVGVIAAGLLALLVLGSLFSLLLVLTLRLPIPGPLLNMARRNLQHQRGRAIVAVIALFVGSFTVGFASAAMLNARDRVQAQRGSDAGTNLRVQARSADQAAVLAALQRADLQPTLALNLDVSVATTNGQSVPITTLEGRSDEDVQNSLRLVSGAWLSVPNQVYLPAAALRSGRIHLGDTLSIKTARREVRVTIAGFFESIGPAWSFGSAPMITSYATIRALGESEARLAVTAAAPLDRLDTIVEQLGRDLPRAMVLSKRDFNDLLVRAYDSLFLFVAGMASLAFLAGTVLIANAVGLALLERKRELGILKAIGYSRHNVLATILLENTILGALAGATGIAAVHIVTALVNFRFVQARMQLGSLTAIAVFLLSVGLALATSALVAWRPTRLRPLAVLRQE